MDEPTSADTQIDLSTLPPPAPMPPAPGPRTSPWVWVAVSLSVVALLASLVIPVLALCAFMVFSEADDSGPSAGYYVDQSSVLDAVEHPCEAADDAAARIRLDGSPQQLARELTTWTAEADLIIEAIDSAHPNADSRAWRDHWKATIRAVDNYAKNLDKPGHKLRLPDSMDDLYWSTDAECGVPVSIVALDPAYGSSFYGELGN